MSGIASRKQIISFNLRCIWIMGHIFPMVVLYLQHGCLVTPLHYNCLPAENDSSKVTLGTITTNYSLALEFKGPPAKLSSHHLHPMDRNAFWMLDVILVIKFLPCYFLMHGIASYFKILLPKLSSGLSDFQFSKGNLKSNRTLFPKMQKVIACLCNSLYIYLNKCPTLFNCINFVCWKICCVHVFKMCAFKKERKNLHLCQMYKSATYISPNYIISHAKTYKQPFC